MDMVYGPKSSSVTQVAKIELHRLAVRAENQIKSIQNVDNIKVLLHFVCYCCNSYHTVGILITSIKVFVYILPFFDLGLPSYRQSLDYKRQTRPGSLGTR